MLPGMPQLCHQCCVLDPVPAMLRHAVPAVQFIIRDSFLGPAELAEIYAATLLNLHPPT